MEKEKLESMLIDFIDGKLSESGRNEVEDILTSDPDARVLYEQLKLVTAAMDRSAELQPGLRMRRRFEAMLSAEQRSDKGRQIFFQPAVTRIAAAVALVLAGIAIGYWINKNQVQQNELAEIRKELEMNKQLMLSMMENTQSASKRMQGVNVALTITSADDEVVTALVKTMNGDNNTNVRLAAVEALSKFQGEQNVRKALIESLGKQTDPVVQIALIQLLVKMKETGVVKELNKIIEDANTIKPVKDEAYTGLMKLS